jgi:hypothetical protein
MPYHPDHLRARRGRLIVIVLALLALAAIYWWSVSAAGRRRALEAPEPMSGAVTPVAPPASPAGGAVP